MSFFPHERDRDGVFLGRIWHPEHGGPCVVTLRDGAVVDITSKDAPLISDICDMDDPTAYVRAASGTPRTTPSSSENRPGTDATSRSRPSPPANAISHTAAHRPPSDRSW